VFCFNAFIISLGYSLGYIIRISSSLEALKLALLIGINS